MADNYLFNGHRSHACQTLNATGRIAAPTDFFSPRVTQRSFQRSYPVATRFSDHGMAARLDLQGGACRALTA
jgi:hypothetical protein